MHRDNIFIYTEYLDYSDISRCYKLFTNYNLIFINRELLEIYSKDKNFKCLNNTHVSTLRFSDLRNATKKILESRSKEYKFHIKSFNDLIIHFNPKLCIFGFDSFLFERLLVEKCKKNKVLTASFIHTGMGFDINFYNIYGKADFYLCWNNFDKSSLIRNGLAANKIIICGTEKYNYISPWLQSRKKRVIIATSNISLSGGRSLSSIDEYIKDFSALVEFIHLNPRIEFVLKPHPSWDHLAFYKIILKEKNLLNLRLFDKYDNIDNLIRSSILFLNFNSFTSLSISAFKFNVPVVVYTPSILPFKKNKLIINDKSLFHIDTLDELKLFFVTLLNNNHILLNKIGNNLYSKIVRADKINALKILFTKMRKNQKIIKSDSNFSNSCFLPHQSGVFGKIYSQKLFKCELSSSDKYSVNLLYLYGLLGRNNKFVLVHLLLLNFLISPVIFLSIFYNKTKLKKLVLFRILRS